MIVLIGGEKGGTGKSTIATNLSVWLAHEGRDVLLLDADHQSTSKKWLDRRNERGGLPVVKGAQAHGDVRAPAEDYAKRYQEVIIDAGGRDSKELRSALVAADVLYVPIRASQADLETMDHVNELVSLARTMNPDLRAFALVSLAPSNPMINEVAEAQAFLEEFSEFKLARTFIRDRKVFRDALLEGCGVVEKANNQAKAEIQLLGEEIYNAANV
ncbi:MAG: chromosome partitioning protein ParA [Chloroflexota bacterium]|nr:MAG: chromosome partitioning protein ParA [Chloroflexota bacterium]